MAEEMENMPKDVIIQEQLTETHINEWLQTDVFHVRWWLLLVMIAAILLIWWLLLDKSRFLEISLFVLLSAILFMGVNEYGEELTLWDYPVDIIPIFPPLSSINLLSLPIVYSLVYQRFPQRKSFIYAVILTSAIICLLIEPLLSWGGFYYLLHWSYFYSFFIYIAVTISVRAIIEKIYTIAKRS
jgi:hypothetical protein